MKNISIFLILFFYLSIFSQRIVSLAPNITETLFYLSYGDKLVGRTSYCDFPPEVKNIKIVGSFIEFNFEDILSVKPDIVFFSNNLTSKAKTFLKEEKIRYFDVKMENITQVVEGMREIVKILDKDFDSTKIDTIVKRIDGIKKQSDSLKILVEVSQQPFIVATEESYIGSILNKMGFILPKMGYNEKPYVTFSFENVLSFKPDIIIFMHDYKNSKNKYSILPEYKKVKFVFLDRKQIDILSRPGPRILEAIDLLEKLLL